MKTGRVDDVVGVGSQALMGAYAAIIYSTFSRQMKNFNTPYLPTDLLSNLKVRFLESSGDSTHHDAAAPRHRPNWVPVEVR